MAKKPTLMQRPPLGQRPHFWHHALGECDACGTSRETAINTRDVVCPGQRSRLEATPADEADAKDLRW